MDSNRLDFLFVLLALLLATGAGWMLVNHGATPLTIGAGLVLLTILTFRLNETLLPIVLILVLAVGSAYDWNIAQKSFYLRFLLLILIVIRGLLYFMKKESASHPTSRFRMTAMHWGYLLFSLIGVVSTFYSADPFVTLQRSLTFFMLSFVILFYFWKRCQSIHECEEYALAMWKCVLVILGIGFFFLAIRVPGMFTGGRLRLVIGNPNQLGHYCAQMTPLAVWVAFEKFPQKWLPKILLLAIAVALIGAGSRGALLSVAVALGILFSLCYRKRLIPMLLGVFMIAGIHLLMGDPAPRPGDDPSFFEETILRRETLETGSGRRGVWKAARRLISDRPFFGYGFGAVDKLFEQGYFPDVPTNFQGRHIHNGYLEEWVNMGYLGALPLFFAFFVLSLQVRKFLWIKNDTPSYRLAAALYGGIVAGLCSGVFESWYSSVGSVFCFPFALMGALLLKTVTEFNDWQANPASRVSEV